MKQFLQSSFLVFGFWFLPLLSSAQTYYSVTDTIGTQSVGGINVTIIRFGVGQPYMYCGVGPYGDTGTNSSIGGYKFIFSSPVYAIRSNFGEINNGDTAAIKLNGVHHNITSANLSNYTGSCSTNPYSVVAVNGNIAGTYIGGNRVQVDIHPGYGIDSAEIFGIVSLSGFYWDFAFSFACPGHVGASAANDSICIGNSLYLLGPANAVSSSASYNWSGPNGFSGTSQNPSLSNVSLAASGKYIITASDTGSCVYKDSINILVSNYPAIPALSTNSPLCVGESLSLSSASSTNGVGWQWSGPNGFTSTIYNPTASNIQLIDSGYYVAIATLNGCSSKDSVLVNVKPLPVVPNASNNSPICAGDTLQFTINNVQSSVSYTWFGPASFTSSNPNPYRLNAQTNYSGTYKVIANLNGCKDSSTTSATVNPSIGPPTISITANPNDTICLGDNATFTATTGNATSPIYQWKHNGANAGTNSISFMPTSVSNGDIIKCHVASNSQCQAIDTALSSGITMHVLSLAPPTLSITYTYSGSFYVFTAHTNPSINLSYQWYKNGNPIAGATGLTYSTSNLTTGDSLCLHVHSGVMCTQPDSVVECLEITTSIFNLQSSISNIKIYPNPATNILYIEASEKVNISISGIEGKTLLYKQDANSINVSKLASGIYIIKVYNLSGLLLKTEKLLKN